MNMRYHLSSNNGLFAGTLAILMFLSSPIWAEEPDLKGREDRLVPVTRGEKENTFRFGKAILDDASGTITIPGYINQLQGAIELIACATKGKTHESILVLDVEPIHLQLAMIRLGLTALQPVRYQGDPEPPKGGRVNIFVEWQADGKKVRYRADELVWCPSKNETMPKTDWVFTGSQVIDGVFQAGVEKSLITTYRDPYTIIDNPSESGINDELFVPNKNILPPIKTPVTLIIEKIPGREKG